MIPPQQMSSGPVTAPPLTLKPIQPADLDPALFWIIVSHPNAPPPPSSLPSDQSISVAKRDSTDGKSPPSPPLVSARKDTAEPTADLTEPKTAASDGRGEHHCLRPAPHLRQNGTRCAVHSDPEGFRGDAPVEFPRDDHESPAHEDRCKRNAR